jgi:hypothetical protein
VDESQLEAQPQRSPNKGYSTAMSAASHTARRIKQPCPKTNKALALPLDVLQPT